ncbi:MAG: OB-fold putative lipoprotein [Treponema sp.]|nr:OB-fold putative lipoprotein [Treponema sp.]
MKRAVLLLFLGLIMMVGLFAQATDAQIRQAATTLGVPYEALKQFVQSYKAQPVPSGTIEITAKQLYEAFRANQLQADMTYKDKTVKVTGVVAGINKDYLDNYYVEIEGTSSFATVDVYVNASELNKIANLKKGQTVMVVGKCDGYTGITVDIKNANIQLLN